MTPDNAMQDNAEKRPMFGNRRLATFLKTFYTNMEKFADEQQATERPTDRAAVAAAYEKMELAKANTSIYSALGRAFYDATQREDLAARDFYETATLFSVKRSSPQEVAKLIPLDKNYHELKRELIYERLEPIALLVELAEKQANEQNTLKKQTKPHYRLSIKS